MTHRHRNRDVGLLEKPFGGTGRTLDDGEPKTFELQGGLKEFESARKRQNAASRAGQRPENLFRVRAAHRRQHGG